LSVRWKIGDNPSKKILTVTDLGEQGDWAIKAEISRARNQ
jgi:hypothetical protein